MKSTINTNKRGAYIVEATIALPIFLIAVIVMSSIILMFHCIENSNFILANELRRAAIEARFSDVAALAPARVIKGIKNSSQLESYELSDYIYRGKLGENDEIIALKIKMHLHTSNPLQLASSADYNLSLCTRAYVGRTRENDPMSEDEFAGNGDAVYIFPSRGEKYHSKDCVVLHAASVATVLSSAIKKKYKSCPKCRSKSAKIGDIVYIFPDEGEAYHLPGCETLERNYIEIERKTAIKRGYKACSKCGG